MSCLHVAPPSVDLKIPPPGPFVGAYVYQGGRLVFQRPAYTTFEFVGSITTSAAPTSLFANSTFCQLRPPSRERKTPRSVFGAYRCPIAATNTTDGSRGSTAILPMCCVSSKPTCVHVAPASVDLYRPLPNPTESRSVDSPVPT